MPTLKTIFSSHALREPLYQKLQELQLKHQQDITQNALVYFESDNGKERFAVHWDQLLYLESQDNYVAEPLPVSRNYVDNINTCLEQATAVGHSSLISDVRP